MLIRRFYKTSTKPGTLPPFYRTSGGGVTFAGGEPMMQANFLREILPELKEKNVHITIDTSGNVPWRSFEKIIDYVDLFLYDLKILDSEKLLAYTGGNLELITENAKSISLREIPMWVRTPTIPGYTDDEENIRKISRFIVENLKSCERFELLAFNKSCESKYVKLGIDWELKNVPLVKKERMEELRKIAEKEGMINVKWSGLTKVRRGK